MAKKGLKWLSARISTRETQEFTSVVIMARIERWKEGLLLAWLLSWTFAGAYFIYYLSSETITEDQRIYMIILISFWVYFEVRIGKAWLWRRFGNEFIRLNENGLSIKQAYGKFGRARLYFYENIKSLTVIDRPVHSLSKQFDSSFWVVGGETISFEHNGRVVRFGKQLTDDEAKELAKYLAKQIGRWKQMASFEQQSDSTDQPENS